MVTFLKKYLLPEYAQYNQVCYFRKTGTEKLLWNKHIFKVSNKKHYKKAILVKKSEEGFLYGFGIF